MHCLKPDDELSRFIFSDRYFDDQGQVKSRLFAQKHPEGFSVFHTTGLCKLRIIKLAIKYVIKDQSKPLLAYCKTSVKNIEEVNLSIVKDTPPPRHHNIFGMPLKSNIEKGKRLSDRQFLLSQSDLIFVNK